MVSENCRSAGTAIGDGLGFVLHPLYKPGENRIDSRTGDTTAALLPKYFGRLANLSAINSDLVMEISNSWVKRLFHLEWQVAI